MNLQDVSHIHIPDGDVRMIHDSDNRLLWGAVGYNVLFSGNTFQQSYTGKNMIGFPARSYSLHDLTFNFAEDGTITINGKRSGTTVTSYNASTLFNFSAGDITFTIIPISGSFSGSNIGYRAIAGNSQVWYQVVSPGGSYSQGTINETAEQVARITRIELLIGSGTAVFDNFKFKLQVTAGSDHDTNFEPYVGGQPSPSPEYPQPIQTVTGQQTVTVTGKNLLNAVPYANPIQQGVEVTITNTNTIHIEGTSTQTYVNLTRIFSTNLPAGTYTMSINKELPFRVNLSTILSGGGSQDRSIQAGETSVTFTTSETTTGMRIFMATGGAGIVFDETFTVQLVSGNAADYDFEPYSSTNYPISLGSIELCKLGDYQDYIWKDGEDWKVHKNIASTRLTSSYDWLTDHVSDQNRLYINSGNLAGAGVRPSSNMQIGQILSTHFSPISITNLLAGDGGIGISQTGFISIRDNEQTTANGFKNWLDNNNIYAYYALATSTDTTITDTNLIAQLEAIYNLVRRYGYNFVVSASGNNLPIIIDRTLL